MELKLRKLQQLRTLQAEYERREADRLAQIDVFATLGYTPTCKPVQDGLADQPCGRCPQELFHAATEDDVLYGGAAGGGKTIALCMEGIRACIRHPGIRVLALRRTYDELEESFFPEMERFGWAAALGGRFDKTGKQLSFPNGSLIRFRYMESMRDATRRQGGAYQLLLVDERTLMPPGVVDVIAFERLRTRGGVPVLGTRSSCNPGGPSHTEVKTRYIEATNHGRDVLTDEHGITRRFIPAKATDNPYLDAAYYRKLDAIPDPNRRAAMRDGDWDRFSGQVFGEWSYQRHTVAPFTLPASWRRYVGIDYGYVAPFAVVWAALDGDGRLWVYRDLAKTQVTEADQAKMIRAAEAEDEAVTVYAADPSMWAKKGEADPPAHVYARNGVPVEPANNDRIIGWHRLHSYFAEGPACELHRAAGWETCPMAHVFTTCAEVIRTIPGLPHATTGNPEDADTTADDHIPDAFRYLAMAVGTEPQFHFPPTEGDVRTLDPGANAPAGTREPAPTPTMIGGFPVLDGGSPWG